jgi:hypothetical protein
MRQNGTTGGATGTLTQVQPTLENWYGVQVARRRRLKRGNQRHERQVHNMNNGYRGNGRSARGRNAIRKRQLGLSHLYAATTPIGGYDDRPMPIDEKCILRHVGGNVNGMIPINNDKGMTAMAGNLKGLQAGSLSMIETNVEWKNFQYRETTNQLLKKTFGGARVEFCTSDVSFEGRYKPGGTATAALGNWSHRVVGSDRDPTGCGRWSYVTYGGKDSKLITYVSV